MKVYLLFFFCFASFLFAKPDTLRIQKIEIGHQILLVEIADRPETRSQGLMGREKLEEGKGMLFIFPKADYLTFWMKNTLIPLSIGFFNADKKLLNILDMEPTGPGTQSYLLYKSKAPALYALEVPQGWFQKHQIRPGMKFSFLDQAD